jgi:hypothetical protein
MTRLRESGIPLIKFSSLNNLKFENFEFSIIFRIRKLIQFSIFQSLKYSCFRYLKYSICEMFTFSTLEIMPVFESCICYKENSDFNISWF